MEQDYWIKKLSQDVDVGENFLRELLAKIVNQSLKNFPAENKEKLIKNEVLYPKQTREEMLSELLIALILKYPSHIDYAINHIGGGHLIGNVNQIIYKNLIIYYNNIIDLGLEQGGNGELKINYQDFKDWMSEGESASHLEDNMEENMNKQMTALNRLMFLADKDFYGYSQEEARSEIINIVTILRKNYLTNRLKEITKLIAQTEKEGGSSNGKMESLMGEFKALAEEMSEVLEK